GNGRPLAVDYQVVAQLRGRQTGHGDGAAGQLAQRFAARTGRATQHRHLLVGPRPETDPRWLRLLVRLLDHPLHVLPAAVAVGEHRGQVHLAQPDVQVGPRLLVDDRDDTLGAGGRAQTGPEHAPAVRADHALDPAVDLSQVGVGDDGQEPLDGL